MITRLGLRDRSTHADYPLVYIDDSTQFGWIAEAELKRERLIEFMAGKDPKNIVTEVTTSDEEEERRKLRREHPDQELPEPDRPGRPSHLPSEPDEKPEPKVGDRPKATPVR